MSELQDDIDCVARYYVLPGLVEPLKNVLDIARRVTNPDNETLAMLNDQPDLYEFSQRQVEALETLGVKMIPVKNEYIITDVLDGLVALGITTEDDE